MQASQDIEVVRKAMSSTGAFPEAAKQVFLEGLPGSIAGTSGMLLEAALEDAKVSATTSLQEVCRAVDAAARDLAQAAEALTEAEAAAEAADAEMQQNVADNAAAARFLRESEKLHKAAETESTHQVKEWAQIREEHDRVTSIVEGSLRMLMSGGWEDAEVMEASVNAVKCHLQKAHADKVLIAAAGPALGSRLDSRAPFDVITVGEVSKCLNDNLAALQSKVAAATPSEKNTRSEILGLWAIADCAREDATQASTAEAIAKKGQKLAQDTLVKAKRAWTRAQHTATELTASRATKEKEVVDVDAAMSAAKRLKIMQADVPLPVVPNAPQPVV